MSREDAALMAKWREIMDNQSMSYQQFPGCHLLARMSGFEDIRRFAPFWVQIEPPPQLLELVLPSFRAAAEQIEQV